MKRHNQGYKKHHRNIRHHPLSLMEKNRLKILGTKSFQVLKIAFQRVSGKRDISATFLRHVHTILFKIVQYVIGYILKLNFRWDRKN